MADPHANMAGMTEPAKKPVPVKPPVEPEKAPKAPRADDSARPGKPGHQHKSGSP